MPSIQFRISLVKRKKNQSYALSLICLALVTAAPIEGLNLKMVLGRVGLIGRGQNKSKSSAGRAALFWWSYGQPPFWVSAYNYSKEEYFQAGRTTLEGERGSQG